MGMGRSAGGRDDIGVVTIQRMVELESPVRRKLSISASVACVLACTLFVALWVQTFFSCDTVFGPLPPRLGFVMTSRQSGLSIGCLLRDVSEWGSHSLPPENVPSLPYKSALGFGFCRTANIVAIRLPYWFLVLATASAARALMKRTPWQFSLRTMLIAMTLVAVLLGLIVGSR
jgi:hypothetical protein